MDRFNQPKLEDPAAKLKSLLETHQLWMLIDRTLFEEVETALCQVERGLFFVDIAENTPIEDSWKASPLLSAINPYVAETILPVFVEELAPKQQAIMLATEKSTTEAQLQKHLGALLIAKVNGNQAWFRFWDSVRLRGLLSVLAEDKHKASQKAYFGTISAILWFEPAPYSEAFYCMQYAHPASSTLNFGSFSFNDLLYAGLSEFDTWCFKRKLFDTYKAGLTHLDKDKTDEEAFEWLYQGVESLGYQTEDGFNDLFALTVQYGRASLIQPSVQKILLNGHLREYVRVNQAREYLSQQTSKGH